MITTRYQVRWGACERAGYWTFEAALDCARALVAEFPGMEITINDLRGEIGKVEEWLMVGPCPMVRRHVTAISPYILL